MAGQRWIEDAVENEIERIQLGAQMQAAFLVPNERWEHFPAGIHMAHVARERGHIVRGIGQLQHTAARTISDAVLGPKARV